MTNISTGKPRILTNMTFWQSATWTQDTDSIYGPGKFGPAAESLPCWKEAFLLYTRRKDYDAVVTMGARESLAYGLLCALTHAPSKQILTEVFIDDLQPWNPLWRIKTTFYRWIAHRAIGILTNSSAELETMSRRFEIPVSRLRYVPMHSNIREPYFSTQDDGFILSAGRSLRDYSLLLEAAPAIRRPIVIICGAHELAGALVPPNVTILREVPLGDYLDYLRRCSLVVIPLLPSERSTGQVVLLEAMAFGKPVIATKSPGTLDHVRHGENGLLIDPSDRASLVQSVKQLIDQPALAKRLGGRASEDVKALYAFDIHAKAKLKAIKELLESQG